MKQKPLSRIREIGKFQTCTFQTLVSQTILITLNSQVALCNCNCSIAIVSNRKRITNVEIVSYQRKHQYENNWQTNKARAVLAESSTSIPTVYLLPNRVKQDSGRGNVVDNKQRDTCRLDMSELVTSKTELVAGCRRVCH